MTLGFLVSLTADREMGENDILTFTEAEQSREETRQGFTLLYSHTYETDMR